MNLLEQSVIEEEKEIQARLNNSNYDVQTPLHPRIQWFYKKWGTFYRSISIKSLPDETDNRYNQEIGY